MAGAETTFGMKVRHWINDTFDNVWMYKVSDRYRSGLPDVIGCVDGKFFAIEFKARGAKPKPHEVLQNHTIEQIKKAGGFSMVVRPENYEEFKKVFRAWFI